MPGAIAVVGGVTVGSFIDRNIMAWKTPLHPERMLRIARMMLITPTATRIPGRGGPEGV
jgi:hypothetical protein